jgi:hypothetical protein
MTEANLGSSHSCENPDFINLQNLPCVTEPVASNLSSACFLSHSRHRGLPRPAASLTPASRPDFQSPRTALQAVSGEGLQPVLWLYAVNFTSEVTSSVYFIHCPIYFLNTRCQCRACWGALAPLSRSRTKLETGNLSNRQK